MELTIMFKNGSEKVYKNVKLILPQKMVNEMKDNKMPLINSSSLKSLSFVYLRKNTANQTQTSFNLDVIAGFELWDNNPAKDKDVK